MSYKNFIEIALKDASSIALEYFGSVSSSVKPEDNNQVLTEADVAIGKMIVSAIQREYPGHNIIDEEAGVIDNNSSTTWVIDPIDGTSNFAAATPLYGCMLGVLENDQPVAGGVVLPGLNQLYLAERGQGATCNGTEISVSSEKKLSNVLVAYGIDGHPENPEITKSEMASLYGLVQACRNLRTSNSAFDIMMVAAGSYGIFFNKTTKIWDNVAPQSIVTEAGGVYTDYNGEPIDYSRALQRSDENFTVCAGNADLHRAAQAIVKL